MKELTNPNLISLRNPFFDRPRVLDPLPLSSSTQVSPLFLTSPNLISSRDPDPISSLTNPKQSSLSLFDESRPKPSLPLD
ncbi:hypothetical protein RchiOBHm_Chr2g0118931 [Rosa chinensis]|uniref:Uncharacterized protein n=1 Tax=Rosa chinensis TaxID=74649 RepID=A0A2P6RRV6_ROSCH|nr:hypothetical protein RchiOBHm_Chr2g0118931 [Rosa chinensis]